MSTLPRLHGVVAQTVERTAPIPLNRVGMKPAPQSASVTGLYIDPSIFAVQVAEPVQQAVLSAAVAMLHGAAAQSADEPTVAMELAPHSTSVTAFAVDPSVFAAQVATVVHDPVYAQATLLELHAVGVPRLLPPAS